jgi:hypothetical protein
MKPSRKRARYDAKNVDQYRDMSGRIFISHLDKIGTGLIGEKKDSTNLVSVDFYRKNVTAHQRDCSVHLMKLVRKHHPLLYCMSR